MAPKCQVWCGATGSAGLGQEGLLGLQDWAECCYGSWKQPEERQGHSKETGSIAVYTLSFVCVAVLPEGVL